MKTGAYFAMAAAVLMLPLWLLLSLVVAGAFHEWCHYLALRLLDVRVYRVTVGPFGASMETEAMEPGRELVCALAGPLGSLMLVPLFRWLPGIALCGLVQGLCNLLPIYPMDGGRVLRSLLEILNIPKGDRILQAVEWTVALGILGLGFWMQLRWDLGRGMVLVGMILILRIIRRKTPCIKGRFGVQ